MGTAAEEMKGPMITPERCDYLLAHVAVSFFLRQDEVKGGAKRRITGAIP